MSPAMSALSMASPGTLSPALSPAMAPPSATWAALPLSSSPLSSTTTSSTPTATSSTAAPMMAGSIHLGRPLSATGMSTGAAEMGAASEEEEKEKPSLSCESSPFMVVAAMERMSTSPDPSDFAEA